MPVQGHDDPRFRGDGLTKGLGSCPPETLRDNKGSVQRYRAGPATGVPGVADGEERSRNKNAPPYPHLYLSRYRCYWWMNKNTSLPKSAPAGDKKTRPAVFGREVLRTIGHYYPEPIPVRMEKTIPGLVGRHTAAVRVVFHSIPADMYKSRPGPRGSHKSKNRDFFRQ